MREGRKRGNKIAKNNRRVKSKKKHSLASLRVSPLDETRHALFSINLLEDLIQDMIFYYSIAEWPPIRKIYENIGDVEKTYKLLRDIV